MVHSQERHLNSFTNNAVQWHHHSNFILMDVTILQSFFSNSFTCYNCSFNLPSVRLLPCVKCCVCHLQQSRWVLLCTHLQMTFLIRTWIWARTTVNNMKCAHFNTAIHRKHFLHDKPLKQSNLILKQHSQQSNSKCYGSLSSSARNEWNYLKFDNFSQPKGIFMRTFFLDKFLLLICTDIFHTKHGTIRLKWHF